MAPGAAPTEGGVARGVRQLWQQLGLWLQHQLGLERLVRQEPLVVSEVLHNLV